MLHIIPKCIMKVLNNNLNVDCMMIYDTNQALQIEIYFYKQKGNDSYSSNYTNETNIQLVTVSNLNIKKNFVYPFFMKL